jgi:hypothetical protein
MNPGAKTFIKVTFGVAALVAASWLLVVQIERFLHRNPSANRVWFYDESEKKLYVMPDTTVPPDRGIGDRAIVVEFPGNNGAPGERKIAYLWKYTPELKQVLDKLLLARAAGKIFDGKIPSPESDYFKGNTLVKSVDETDWHPANTPEGRNIVNAWRSWRGADGGVPRICPAS